MEQLFPNGIPLEDGNTPWIRPWSSSSIGPFSVKTFVLSKYPDAPLEHIRFLIQKEVGYPIFIPFKLESSLTVDPTFKLISEEYFDKKNNRIFQ